ncbi:MAG TPA: sensor histidine kinase, partial [Pilimelia sp.]|nr:sensor histidine kinase [Pilimelia sp.]
VRGVTAFLEPALAAGAPVLVAVPGDNLGVLRSALAGRDTRVRFADMTVAGRNPGRILPTVLLPFAADHPGERPWIVGEPVWPGRTADEYPECVAHEALINAAFAGRDAAILCPYDAAGLDEVSVADAARTHPAFLRPAGDRVPSRRYADPLALAAECNVPLPPVPTGAAALAYDAAVGLGAVRRFVSAQARGAGLADDRADDLVVAVNELAANTIAHTPGEGTVRVWAEGGQVRCQVDDGGYLADPLAGRIPPAVDVPGGRGLILVHRLCDLVRVHRGVGGTAVRLHVDGAARLSRARSQAPQPGCPAVAASDGAGASAARSGPRAAGRSRRSTAAR